MNAAVTLRTLRTLHKLVLAGTAGLLAVAALGACTGGSVDQQSCDAVMIGDSRGDVDSRLGTAESVKKAENGFAVARYKSTVSGAEQCCLVTFDRDTTTAITAARPTFQKSCQ